MEGGHEVQHSCASIHEGCNRGWRSPSCDHTALHFYKPLEISSWCARLVCTPGVLYSYHTLHPVACVAMGPEMCVTRRKQQRPGIASNDDTTHVPTARSSADLTKPNHTPTRHSRAKDKIILQLVTPQAAASQRTHVSRTQDAPARTRSPGG